MNPFEKKSADHYHDGKSHISVYIVIVLNQPDYKVNLKTALKNGNGWRWNQIITGEDYDRPMQTWEDVDFVYRTELERLSAIIIPLFEENKIASYTEWCKINHRSATIIKGMDDNDESDELTDIERLCKKSLGIQTEKKRSKFEMMTFLLPDPENDPRTEISHWIPIWNAWKHSYEVFKNDMKNNVYVDL